MGARVGAPVLCAAMGLALLACDYEGAACETEGDWICLDSTSALVCHGGKKVRIPCGGGCITTKVSDGPDTYECKYHAQHEGDPCIGGDGKSLFVCDAEGRNDLVCGSDLRFAIDRPCKGAGGCEPTPAGRDHCDDALADVGDKCRSERGESLACSADHKGELVCRNGKFELYSVCKGPRGCVVAGFECDSSVGDVGDACPEQRGDANYACSADKTSLVVCRDGKFAPSRACRGRRGCWLDDGRVAHCDTSVAREADDCGPSDVAACGEDGRSALECSEGKWVTVRACKAGRCRWSGQGASCSPN
jgi:hypothetical protein